jgi:hypothetical protein
MAIAVVTVTAGGLPVIDVTATQPGLGMAVTEAANGRGVAVTKVAAGKLGIPVVYVVPAIGAPLDEPPEAA